MSDISNNSTLSPQQDAKRVLQYAKIRNQKQTNRKLQLTSNSKATQQNKENEVLKVSIVKTDFS